MVKKCTCTMAKSLTGDGCRYCQPQEYIDRLIEQSIDDQRKLALVGEALARCKATLAEGYRHTALLKIMAELGGILESEF